MFCFISENQITDWCIQKNPQSEPLVSGLCNSLNYVNYCETVKLLSTSHLQVETQLEENAESRASCEPSSNVSWKVLNIYAHASVSFHCRTEWNDLPQVCNVDNSFRENFQNDLVPPINDLSIEAVGFIMIDELMLLNFKMKTWWSF